MWWCCGQCGLSEVGLAALWDARSSLPPALAAPEPFAQLLHTLLCTAWRRGEFKVKIGGDEKEEWHGKEGRRRRGEVRCGWGVKATVFVGGADRPCRCCAPLP